MLVWERVSALTQCGVRMVRVAGGGGKVGWWWYFFFEGTGATGKYTRSLEGAGAELREGR